MICRWEILKMPTLCLFLYPCDAAEALTIISDLNPAKSTVPNSIQTNLLQLMKYEVSEPLSNLTNLSLSKGIFPGKLKIATVIPIYKSGSRVLVYYRPISLLSNLDKIFEKIVYARLQNFLNSNNSIFYQQFGFRHNCRKCS